MVPTLTGTERLSVGLREFVEKNIDDALFFPDIDIDDPKRQLPFTDRDPVFDFRFQILNETRGIPIIPIRCNFYFGLRRSNTIGSDRQYDKLMVIRDKLYRLLKSSSAANFLQFREFRMLNSSFNARNDLFLLLTQFEFRIFLQRGEY